MGLATPALPSFTAGEWSPMLAGRTDLAKYQSACSILENMIITPYGPIRKRMGTEMIDLANAADGRVRLLPFVYSITQAYVVEVTPAGVRFFRDGGLVPGQIGLPAGWTWADIEKMTYCQSADIMYWATPNQHPVALRRTGPDIFSFALVTGVNTVWPYNGTWPSCVTFHQQRLWFGGQLRLTGSKVGDFTNFSVTTDDDSPLVLQLVATQRNDICWMYSARGLAVGSTGGEWAICGENVDSALTIKNRNARLYSMMGSAVVQPLMAGKAVLYVSADRHRIQELYYNFGEDGFESNDITLLAEHLTQSRIKEITYAPDPSGIIWAVMEDGQLAGCTYLRAQEVVGWYKFVTQGKVLSVVSIPHEEGYSDTWMAVKRETGVYIERKQAQWRGQSANEPEYWYVDCGAQYQGAPVTSVSGLGYLEGQTVAVLADGAYHSEQVVTGGRITLESPASLITVGLPYHWKYAPMTLDGFSERGSAQGKKSKIVSVTVRLRKSLNVQYGFPEPGASIYEAPNRTVEMLMDNAPTPFSGDKDLSFPNRWSSDARFVLQGDKPFSATIITCIPKVVANE